MASEGISHALLNFKELAMHLTLLDTDNPEQQFPAVSKALKNPNGLLAIGGCLTDTRLINAYQQGIFPWYNPGEPILWWSPDPRLVLFPNHLHVSRSMVKTLQKQLFSITFDQCFTRVIEACAAPRSYESGTWLNEEMLEAYTQLHRQGIAHSVEVWMNKQLVGGLYGVAIGQVFFGESMFHTETNASKAAFIHLTQHLDTWGYHLIDCQVRTEHLISLGAEEISRQHFTKLLRQFCPQLPPANAWKK